jgi:hypothetical protein
MSKSFLFRSTSSSEWWMAQVLCTNGIKCCFINYRQRIQSEQMTGLIAFHWKSCYKYFMTQKPWNTRALYICCQALPAKKVGKKNGESVSQAGVLKLTGRLRSRTKRNDVVTRFCIQLWHWLWRIVVGKILIHTVVVISLMRTIWQDFVHSLANLPWKWQAITSWRNQGFLTLTSFVTPYKVRSERAPRGSYFFRMIHQCPRCSKQDKSATNLALNLSWHYLIQFKHECVIYSTSR